MELAYSDGGQRLLGELAVPDKAKFGDGPFPGVVVVHEVWGLTDQIQTRIQRLADLGYVALAADIYGDRYLPRDMQEGMQIIGEHLGDRLRLRVRAGAAVAALRDHPACDGRIAATGYCFGGSVVLELARGNNPDVLGVVSFHGGLGGGGPIEPSGIKPKILVLHGAEDPLVKHDELVNFLIEMRDARADCQTVCYTGVVHAFTNPAATGEPNPAIKYHEPSDRRSWAAMQNFFKTELFV